MKLVKSSRFSSNINDWHFSPFLLSATSAFWQRRKAWLAAGLIISLFFAAITVISQCEGVEATNTMSKFRKFGLPRLLDRIGHGAFGDVFTANYQAPGKDSKETVVVKKMINAMDAEEKKLFLKELTLLGGLNHLNVVKFMSVWHQPPAMMLEYVYFDFNLFGPDVRVSTLSDFLIKIDEYDSVGFQELVSHAATEIISGLAYLHQTGIAHRDLKTANILVWTNTTALCQ